MSKAQSDLILIQETQLKKMAEELGSHHQMVLFAQQLDQLKNRVYGKLSELRAGIEGLPLFDFSQRKGQLSTKEEGNLEKKKRTLFGRKA